MFATKNLIFEILLVLALLLFSLNVLNLNTFVLDLVHCFCNIHAFLSIYLFPNTQKECLEWAIIFFNNQINHILKCIANSAIYVEPSLLPLELKPWLWLQTDIR